MCGDGNECIGSFASRRFLAVASVVQGCRHDGYIVTYLAGASQDEHVVGGDMFNLSHYLLVDSFVQRGVNVTSTHGQLSLHCMQ